MRITLFYMVYDPPKGPIIVSKPLFGDHPNRRFPKNLRPNLRDLRLLRDLRDPFLDPFLPFFDPRLDFRPRDLRDLFEDFFELRLCLREALRDPLRPFFDPRLLFFDPRLLPFRLADLFADRLCDRFRPRLDIFFINLANSFKAILAALRDDFRETRLCAR